MPTWVTQARQEAATDTWLRLKPGNKLTAFGAFWPTRAGSQHRICRSPQVEVLNRFACKADVSTRQPIRSNPEHLTHVQSKHTLPQSNISTLRWLLLSPAYNQLYRHRHTSVHMHRQLLLSCPAAAAARAFAKLHVCLCLQRCATSALILTKCNQKWLSATARNIFVMLFLS